MTGESQIIAGDPMAAATLRIALVAPDYAAQAVQTRLEAEVARAVIASARLPRRGPIVLPAGPLDLIVLYVDGRTDAPRLLKQMGRPDLPTVVLREAAGATDVCAAIEAGAADCVPFASLRYGELAALLARAVAHGARYRTLQREVTGLAAALESARAECEQARAAALTDGLTGLYNRRYFTDRLEAEENLALRSGRPLALILADLDHFKTVNDLYGHAGGDAVLRAVAAATHRCLRSSDVACRYGGEELALILPDTSAEQAVAVAERVRLSVRRLAFDALAKGLGVTASCGVADLPSEIATTQDGLVRAADRALYIAKERGRDRTVLASAGLFPAGDPTAPLAPQEMRAAIEKLRRSVRAASSGIGEGCLRAIEETIAAAARDRRRPVFGAAEDVASYGVRIAGKLGLGGEEVERIRRAGILQDIGMVPIAERIEHAGALTAGERELVRQHPAISMRIASELRFFDDELPTILHHHENYDGSGYPRGIRGERIPVGSRVLAVAAAYEAMTSSRPYRPALPPEDAAAEIERGSGTRYDPEVVRAFHTAFAAAS